MKNSQDKYHRIRRLHGERNGQSMVMVVLVLFTLVCFMGFAINVGHRVTQKVEMQNTIDASTYSAAAWNARGLNMISVLNVAMTECLALIILAKAYDKIIDHAETILYPINLSAATAACAGVVTSVWGCPWLTLVEIAGSSFTYLNAIKKVFNAIAEQLWNIMSALETVEAVVRWATPMAGQYRASQIAADKGAAPLFGLKVGKVGMHAAVFPLNPLPVEKGEFSEICQRTIDGTGDPRLVEKYITLGEVGGNDGWEKSINMKVPLEIAKLDLGFRIKEALRLSLISLSALMPPPVLTWGAYVKGAGASICSDNPDDSSFEIANNTDDLELCASKNGIATWVGKGDLEVDSSATCNDKAPPPEDGKRQSNRNGSSRELVESDYDVVELDRPATMGSPPDNSLPIVEDRPRRVCQVYPKDVWEECFCSDQPACTHQCTEEEINTSWGKGKKKVTKYYKDDWLLKECIYQDEQTFEASEEDEPQPYVLKDDYDEFLHFSGIAYKKVTNRVTLSGKSKNEKMNYVISRAYVYNPTTADTFTQDWRVTLEPFTMEGLKLDIFNVSEKIDDIVSTESKPVPPALQSLADGISAIVDGLITH